MDISRIPAVMRDRLNWQTAAALMERWFSSSANDRPETAEPERTIVRLEWALAFPRARQAYDTLLTTRAWCDRESQRRISRWLWSQNRLAAQPMSFGARDFQAARPETLTNDCICTRSVGALFDRLDDLYGALGRFDFRAVVRGTVRPVPTSRPAPTMSRRAAGPPSTLTSYEVSIEAVGIYIWDSYDFNGTQLLGYWSELGVSRSPLSGYDAVTNEDFRQWRQRHGRGGDFCIFSDVQTIPRRPPDTFVTF